MNVKRLNKYFTEVNGRTVQTLSKPPAVILSLDESSYFEDDYELQDECIRAAKAAGLKGLVACGPVGGPICAYITVK